MISSSSPRRASTPTPAKTLFRSAAACAALTLIVGGCSSQPGQTAAPQPAGAAPTLQTSDGKDYSKVPAPGPALGDASSLRGKTVYWIPITSVAPIFTVEQKNATEAFAAMGVKLQLCDGQATPEVVGRCVGQAVAAKAAGIITTSTPPEFARQAFDGAVAAGIPMLFVNTKDATVPSEWGKKAAAMPNNWNAQGELNNKLIVADSGGKASVLQVGVTDSSATTAFFEQGMKGNLTEQCPGCTISDVQTSSTQISNLTSLVSSALVKRPDTKYVVVQFDSFAAPVIQAIRQQNKQNSIKLLTHLGQLDSLKRVADGQQFADTGYSIAALGWNEADAMMRMMLGQDPLVDKHVTPIKTFTKDNAGTLDLTQAGWESGKWDSSDDFRAMYKELWPATS